ncbi:MAG TPA: potassium-transporting ATPase subunit KdpC [Chthonomonadaceae bacterium]|nr:potassium-transporting ATPase subunit KdpC [Chthonomonadaceae bacterium]
MFQQLRPAVMSVLVMTIAFGLVFPAVITGVARVAFPRQAGGSLVVRDGKVIGSDLIGQSFAAPGYFHPRPSAAGNGYDASNSGGTNLGPTSDKLINGVHKRLANGKDDPGNFDGIKDLAAAYRKENGLAADAPIPADAATRSASGLDPNISPANAEVQVKRVAAARGLSGEAVRQIVARNTEGRDLWVLGEPRVNVLRANLALDSAAPGKSGTAPAK